MACNALSTKGTLFQVDIAAVFTTVGNVVDVGQDDDSTREIRTVSCLSEQTASKVIGILTPGSVTVAYYFQFDDPAQDVLRDALEPGTLLNFKEVLTESPTPTEISYSGYVVGISKPIPDGEELIQTVSIEKTTKDTYSQ